MVMKYKKKHFTFQGPPKFAQIVIFGLKINHLADLLLTAHKIFQYNNSLENARTQVATLRWHLLEVKHWLLFPSGK
jgi:hypothetical protein